MDDFRQTLSKFEVPKQQQELKAIAEGTKEAIVYDRSGRASGKTSSVT